jgi:hypothetical protein
MFNEHAADYWPESHHPHHRDAVEYCAFLNRLRPEAVYGPEWNAVNFAVSGRLLAMHLFAGFREGGKTRTVLQVLFRLKDSFPRQVFFYLGLV